MTTRIRCNIYYSGVPRDADLVRDDVRSTWRKRSQTGAECSPSPRTSDVKKGVEYVGVQRQSTGAAGQIENAQVSRSRRSIPLRSVTYRTAFHSLPAIRRTHH